MATTTYVGYVRTGKSNDPETGEKEFNEFLAERECRAMGIDAWVARKIEFRRTGKKRRPEPFEEPYMLNYIFLPLTPETYYRVTTVKNLASTLHPVGRLYEKNLADFRRGVEVEYSARRSAAANREAIAEFQTGDRLESLDPRFLGQLMTFRRIVERAHDLHPKIQADMEMFGRTVMVELDPLNVKRAV